VRRDGALPGPTLGHLLSSPTPSLLFWLLILCPCASFSRFRTLLQSRPHTAPLLPCPFYTAVKSRRCETCPFPPFSYVLLFASVLLLIPLIWVTVFLCTVTPLLIIGPIPEPMPPQLTTLNRHTHHHPSPFLLHWCL